MKKKTKIVVDSDVLIHFSKGEALSLCRTFSPNMECNDFIHAVRSKGSKLPDIDIENYICEVEL